jgi:hypothetical protein
MDTIESISPIDGLTLRLNHAPIALGGANASYNATAPHCLRCVYAAAVVVASRTFPREGDSATKRKITLWKMKRRPLVKSALVGSWSTAATTSAPITSRSTPIAGPMIFGCLTLSRYSSVRLAAIGAPMSGRSLTGNGCLLKRKPRP